MKKIAAVILCFILFATTVSAASVNGTYKGKPIVKVKSNGAELKSDSSPAVIMDGRTMIPISMLKQLGASVAWDAKTSTVDVSFPSNFDYNNVHALAKELKSDGISYVAMTSSGEDFIEMAFYYDGTLDELNQNNKLFDTLLTSSSMSDATWTRIIDISGAEFSVLTDYVRDFKNGKITGEQLVERYHITQPGGSSSSGSSGTSSSAVKSKITDEFEGYDYGNLYELDNGQIWKQTDYTYQYHYAYRPNVTIYKDGLYYYIHIDGMRKDAKVERVDSTGSTSASVATSTTTTSPTTTSPSTSATTSTNAPSNCKALQDQYVLNKQKLGRTVNPFSGKASYDEKLFEYTWDEIFTANGCTRP